MYDKTEELKKVLELDKEAIQSKLIEEKLRLDEETRIENEKQKKLFYVLITIVIIILALGITAYTLTKDTTKTEERLETSKIIEEKNKPIVKKETSQIKIIEQKKEPVKVEIKEVIKVVEKIVEKEVIIEKEVPMSRNKLISLLNGKKFNIAKCYDYTNTTLKPTNTCKETLEKFFIENKDAIRFEVIGVIGEDDIKKATKKTEDKKLKNYIIRGVARDRVIEASWLIKEVHKSKALITAVNFYITSKKNNKGIVVRAYH